MDKILLIDDDRLFQQVVQDLLGPEGYRVTVAQDAEEASPLLVRGHGFSLLLVDICLSGLDGWGFLDFVRKDLGLDWKTLPAIVVSALDSTVLEMNAFRHQANAWLVKPINPPEKLLVQVRALTGHNKLGGEEQQP